MAATFTTYLSLAKPFTGDLDWGPEVDGNFDLMDAAIYANREANLIRVSGGGDVTYDALTGNIAFTQDITFYHGVNAFVSTIPVSESPLVCSAAHRITYAVIGRDLVANESITAAGNKLLKDQLVVPASNSAFEIAVRDINGDIVLFNGAILKDGQTGTLSGGSDSIPFTSLGDTLYGGASGTPTRLPGNTTTTKKFYTQTGDGTVSAAPGWADVAAADVVTVRLVGRRIDGINLTGVTGLSTDVTSQMVTAGATPSVGDTSKGVVVLAPDNGIVIRSNNTGSVNDQIVDASGNAVYGRLTYSSGTWTLSFFVDIDGTETPYTMTGQNIKWYYQQLFNPITDAPIYDQATTIPSDNATRDVLDADATRRGLVSAGTQTLGGDKTFAGSVIIQGSTTLSTGLTGILRAVAGLVSASAVDLNSSDVTGTLPIANGGTGQITANAAFNALSPMTTLGDIIYGAASGVATRLAGNTSTTRMFLSQTGDGANSGAPVWATTGSGVVTLGLAGSGADYIFDGTAASYTAAATDSRLTNGGTLFFLNGTYNFATIPTFLPGILHRGSAKGAVALQLPSGSFTGASGAYSFQGLTFQTSSSAVTFNLQFTTTASVILRDCSFGTDARFLARSTGTQYAEDVDFSSGFGLHDIGGGSLLRMVNCTTAGTWFLRNNSQLIAVDSTFALLDTTSTAGTNSGAVFLVGCTVSNISNSAAHTWTNCHIVGSSVPNGIPAFITGRFDGNTPLLANRDYADLGNQGLTFSIDWDAKQSLHLKVTLTANVAISAITGVCPGKKHILQVTQDGTGSRTITSYPGNVVWLSGTAPTLSTTAGAVDDLEFITDGTTLYGYKAGSGSGSGTGVVTVGQAGSGADYTGNTQAVFTSAFADTKLANGGTIIVLAGTYTFSSNPAWPSNVTIRGVGRDASILSYTASGTGTPGGSSGNYAFEDLSITSSGAFTFSFPNTGTENVRFRNVRANSIYLNFATLGRQDLLDCDFGGAPTTLGQTVNARNCTFGQTTLGPLITRFSAQGCTFTGVSPLIANTGANKDKALILVGCKIAGVISADGFNLTNVVISGCDVVGGIPSVFSGRFDGNTPVTTNRDYWDLGDQGANFAINWDTQQSMHLRVRLTANVSITSLTNGVPGRLHILQVVQDGTGNRTLGLPGSVIPLTGSPLGLSSSANAVDIIAMFYDGTSYYAFKVGMTSVVKEARSLSGSTITLSQTPMGDDYLLVFVDDRLEESWTRAGTTVTFDVGSVPIPSQSITAWYIKSGSFGGSGSSGFVAVGSRLAPVVVNPAAGITPTTDLLQHWFVKGPTAGGAQMISTTPQIGPGSAEGQTLRLTVVDGADYPKTQDDSGTASGLLQNGDWPPPVRANGATISYSWDGVYWSENSRA